MYVQVVTAARAAVIAVQVGINTKDAMAVLRKHGFELPGFCFWCMALAPSRGTEQSVSGILKRMTVFIFFTLPMLVPRLVL